MSTDQKRLLLISNSTLYGSGYLDHAENQIKQFLGSARKVVFIPYALHDLDTYANKARERFQRMGYELTSVHSAKDSAQAVSEADAIFIGGGNTFRLLNALYQQSLLPVIRQRVRDGIPYIGTSAGSNVACPTIKTTNDMPIVQPPSFNAIGLIPFQINPHYLDPVPGTTHMGETREERIIQFLEENDTSVIGLREGSMVHFENGSYLLKGSTGARVFLKGQKPFEMTPGIDLNSILNIQ